MLLFVDVPQGAYDYRTKVQQETFYTTTAVGQTSANVTLIKDIYNNDYSTLSFLSSDTVDSPILSTYNASTRQALVAGLAASTTRTLTASYDVNALSGLVAIDVVMDLTPYFWYLMVFVFMAGSIVYMWTGNRN